MSDKGDEGQPSPKQRHRSPSPAAPPTTTAGTSGERPSLPSIHSLFGIRREDDLETLLPPPPGPSATSDTYPAAEDGGESKTQPAVAGGTYGVQHPGHDIGSPPRPSRSLRPISTAYESTVPVRRPGSPEPSPAAATDAGGLRRPSDASFHRPETPEGTGSSRMDPRAVTALRQLHSPSSVPRFPTYSPAASQRPLGTGTSSGHTSTSASYPYDDHPQLHPQRTPRDSISSMSTTSSSFFGVGGGGGRATLHHPTTASSSSESVPLPSDRPSRRHTISDSRGGAVRSPRTHSRPASPYSTGRRRASPATSTHSAFPLITDITERTLAPLPGLTSQSESQLPLARPLPPSAYGSGSRRPTSSSLSAGSSSRPMTSPGTAAGAVFPPSISHPPSSFPRRLSIGGSGGGGGGGTALPPQYLPSASSSATVTNTNTSVSSSFTGPSPSTPSSASSSRQPQRGAGYEGGRHRLYSATEPTSSGSGSGAVSTATTERHKYECPYCKKGFNRPSSLKIHVNTHTGEKPFQCSVPGCDRRFSVMSNMRRHARTHDQARFLGNTAVEVEDGEDEAPESPVLEPSGSGTPKAGPSTSRASRGVGRLQSPKTTRTGKASRRPFPGPFQEPSMETIGLLRPASPTPTPPLSGAEERLVPLVPTASLAGTAHRLYEEARREERQAQAQSSSPPPPQQQVAGPSTASTSTITTTEIASAPPQTTTTARRDSQSKRKGSGESAETPARKRSRRGKSKANSEGSEGSRASKAGSPGEGPSTSSAPAPAPTTTTTRSGRPKRSTRSKKN